MGSQLRFARSSVRLGLVLAGGLIAGTLSGCVGQGQYDNLYETNRSLTEDNTRLNRELEESKRSLALLQGNTVNSEGGLTAMQRQNADLRSQLDRALADLRDLNGRIAGLAFGPIDQETDQALQVLAAQYPDMIKYDPASGMLRFASDLTFDSGSAVVKSDAKNALNALGKVLSSSAAAQYQIWVEGHTDAQRISAGTAKTHPTNRHLSAHRAISVIEELSREGVSPSKMMAAGWGEFHPAIPNSPNGNTPANRRVEIFLAKARDANATNTNTTPATKSTKSETTKTPAKEIDVTK